MIVEDEYGNDVDLHDLDQPDPEPPDPEDASLTLEQIEAAHTAYLRDPEPDPTVEAEIEQAASMLLDVAVPQLIAELRAARAELETWRAIPVTVEYLLTDGRRPARGVVVVPVIREEADTAWWEHHTGRSVHAPWAKATYVTGWKPHVAPPF